MKNELNTPPQKKTWSTPQIYILDSGTVNGGGFQGGHEVHTPNHTKVVTTGGFTTNAGGMWNNYHS